MKSYDDSIFDFKVVLFIYMTRLPDSVEKSLDYKHDWE